MMLAQGEQAWRHAPTLQVYERVTPVDRLIARPRALLMHTPPIRRSAQPIGRCKLPALPAPPAASSARLRHDRPANGSVRATTNRPNLSRGSATARAWESTQTPPLRRHPLAIQVRDWSSGKRAVRSFRPNQRRGSQLHMGRRSEDFESRNGNWKWKLFAAFYPERNNRAVIQERVPSTGRRRADGAIHEPAGWGAN